MAQAHTTVGATWHQDDATETEVMVGEATYIVLTSSDRGLYHTTVFAKVGDNINPCPKLAPSFPTPNALQAVANHTNAVTRVAYPVR